MQPFNFPLEVPAVVDAAFVVVVVCDAVVDEALVVVGEPALVVVVVTVWVEVTTGWPFCGARHWEYHSLITTQFNPASHLVGPVVLFKDET